MDFAESNGITLCYDTIGDPAGRPLLLVMGLGAQLLAWDSLFCEALAEQGCFVIRFDNRDSGLSTSFVDSSVDLPAVMKAWAEGTPMPLVPYLLADMADDAFGLLDHLGLPDAHIVGASLGGMIVQTMAIRRPERVRSLTSIMSTTGDPRTYQSVPEVRAALLAPVPEDRDGFIRAQTDMVRLLSSRRHFDPVRTAAMIGASYDRSFLPSGRLRQTAAIRASGSRDDQLRTLDLPTLVIHGRDDTLILPVAGEHTAEIIPGASLLVLNDMGHDLPPPLWPVIVDAIVGHAARADRGR